MRNAAALADKKERSAGLEAQLRAKQSTLPGNRHRAIYARHERHSWALRHQPSSRSARPRTGEGGLN
jgi:hypothetical protein